MGVVRDKKLLLRIALVIKDLRIEKGVSQEDVYNETNVHIGRIEACKINPTVTTLAILMKYFNLRLSEFFQMVEGKK